MINVAIFAGGVGSRMQSDDLPKQFIEVEGKPIIIHTIEVFNNHPRVSHISISCLEAWIPDLEKLIELYELDKVVKIVPGGSSGHYSIQNALLALKDYSDDDDLVMICDGVRPMVSTQLIDDCIRETREYGTAIPVTPSIDSVLESVDGVMCSKRHERSHMYITQAPQGFIYKNIMDAHQKAEEIGLKNPISSGELLLQLGEEVHIFLGDRRNIKVTTPEDIYALRSGFYYDNFKRLMEEEEKYGV